MNKALAVAKQNGIVLNESHHIIQSESKRYKSRTQSLIKSVKHFQRNNSVELKERERTKKERRKMKFSAVLLLIGVSAICVFEPAMAGGGGCLWGGGN